MARSGPPAPVDPNQRLPAHLRAKGNVRVRTLRQLIDRYAGKDGEKIVQCLAVLAFGDSEGRRNLFGEHVKCDSSIRMRALEVLAARRWGQVPVILDPAGNPDAMPVTIVNVYSPVPIGSDAPEQKTIAAKAVRSA
jgi:hypothetical protein